MEPETEVRNINEYCQTIQHNFKYFNTESVHFYKSRIELQPWLSWNQNQSPKWWSTYNKVKHRRMDLVLESQKPYYKFANLENVINDLAGLYIIEQYYIYCYDFESQIEITRSMELNPNMIEDKILQDKGNAFLGNRSNKCCMKQWQEGGCYMEFLGQDFFECKNLKKL